MSYDSLSPTRSRILIVISVDPSPSLSLPPSHLHRAAPAAVSPLPVAPPRVAPSVARAFPRHLPPAQPHHRHSRAAAAVCCPREIAPPPVSPSPFWFCTSTAPPPPALAHNHRLAAPPRATCTALRHSHSVHRPHAITPSPLPPSATHAQPSPCRVSVTDGDRDGS
jgi:hypothetical protein